MYIMPIYYTLHTLVYKYNKSIPLPDSPEDRHCLMILGGTVAWTIIWIALNSIQNHPLWNALRSSFIAILTADIAVMLYIWNRNVQLRTGKTKTKSSPRRTIIPISHTTSALNDYYNSIQGELETRKLEPDSIRAKAEQELVLKEGERKISAVSKIQGWWRNKNKTKKEEFHTILAPNAL